MKLTRIINGSEILHNKDQKYTKNETEMFDILNELKEMIKENDDSVLQINILEILNEDDFYFTIKIEVVKSTGLKEYTLNFELDESVLNCNHVLYDQYEEQEYMSL